MESQIKTSTVYRIKKETVHTDHGNIDEGPILEEFEVPLTISICYYSETNNGVSIQYCEETDEKNWWNSSCKYKVYIGIDSVSEAKALYVNAKNYYISSGSSISITSDSIIFRKASDIGRCKWRYEKYTIYWDDKGRNEFLETLKRLFIVLEEYKQL